jgi:hypothetical protein
MSVRKMHEIWIEQYDAAQGIKLTESCIRLFGCRKAAIRRSSCRAPRIRPGASSVRVAGEADVHALEIKTHIARVEPELHDKSIPVEGDDDLIRESPTTIAKRAGQLATIKELLTATELGTS